MTHNQPEREQIPWVKSQCPLCEGDTYEQQSAFINMVCDCCKNENIVVSMTESEARALLADRKKMEKAVRCMIKLCGDPMCPDWIKDKLRQVLGE